MKLFEEALSAPTEAAAIRVLLSCDPSEYPSLREAARCEAERIKAEPRVGVYRSDEFRRQQFREWVTAAAVIITWDKKSVPNVIPSLLRDVLTDEGIADHFSKSPPPWLESALEFDKWDVIYDRVAETGALHMYVTRSCLPPPPAGHDFYRYILSKCHNLPEFSEDRVLAYLRKYPVVVDEILPRALRRMAEKSRYGSLLKEEIEWWENGRKLPPGETPSPSLLENRRPTGKYLSTPLARALRELANNGEIDRFALPRTCLEAIADARREIETRDLRRCHDFLVNGTAEVELFNHYLSLLASPFSPVVKFAVDHLGTLLGKISPEQARQLLSEIPPALTHTKSKPLILQTIRIVRSIVEHFPSTYPASVDHIVQSLSLPALDIQKEVLAILEMGPKAEKEKARPAVAAFRAQITGSLKKSFEPWFADVAEVKAVHPATTVKLDLSAMPLGEHLTPLDSVDDIVYSANSLLSKSPDPMLLELLMAGLAKLPRESRDSLSKKLAPLHKRALKKFDHAWDLPCWVERLAAELIVRFGPEPDAGGRSWIAEQSDAPGALRFLSLRILEILDPKRPPRILLGTPQTSLGFIGFGTLLARTTEALAATGSVDHCDFIQGIARVHLGAETTAPAHPSDPEALRVLHFLACGEIIGEARTEVWWVTAARIRDPKKDYSDVAKFRDFTVALRPDWLQPARYNKIEKGHCHFLSSATHDLLAEIYDPHWKIPSDVLLSLRFGMIFSDAIINYDADIRWLFSVAPIHLEPILGQALLVTHSGSGLTPGPLKTAIPVIFEELARRKPALGETMRLHLVCNLSSNLPASREATPELWLQAEVDGFLEPMIPEMAQEFRRALLFVDWRDKPLFPMFDLTRVNPALHVIKDLHPNLPLRLRDMLLGAFSQGFEWSPRSIGKTLELLLSLVIDYPVQNAPDLSALAASPLGSKELGVIKKINKVLGR